METKGDPEIGDKASEMRSQGLSWSEIASSLSIGKTTARRLVSLHQKDEDNPIRTDADGVGPIRKVTCTFSENEGDSINQPQDDRFPLKDDVLNKLPKTFQILNSLLEKARQKQAK